MGRFVFKSSPYINMLMNTGFKMVNDLRNKDLTLLMLDHFKKDPNLTAEIGLYFEKNEINDIFQQYFAHASGRVNHHFRCENTVWALQENKKAMLKELKLAKTLQCSFSVIHLTASPTASRFFPKEKRMRQSLPLFIDLNKIGEDFNHDFYLENIYSNIPFYRQLFAQFREKDLKHIHFCMDLGHAKACSKNTISEWYEFLRELETHGHKIHFHLHMNYGFADDHLSLIEYMYPRGDWFSGGMLYDHLMRDLITSFPDSRKIFEVKPEYAISNMAYVKRMLDEAHHKSIPACTPFHSYKA